MSSQLTIGGYTLVSIQYETSHFFPHFYAISCLKLYLSGISTIYLHHLSIHLLGICLSSFVNSLLIFLPTFLLHHLLFLLILGDFIYSEYQVLIDCSHPNIFSVYLLIFNFVYDFCPNALLIFIYQFINYFPYDFNFSILLKKTTPTLKTNVYLINLPLPYIFS